MYILTISRSSRPDSSNSKLLDHLEDLNAQHVFERCDLHFSLPLFRAELDTNPLSREVKEWRTKIEKSDAVVFCIPEYIHNMPAAIKNALEWLTSSGELAGKPVIAITLTPQPPRGEKAMNSLIWSLQALDARIIVQLALYKSQIEYDLMLKGEGADILKEALSLLV